MSSEILIAVNSIRWGSESKSSQPILCARSVERTAGENYEELVV